MRQKVNEHITKNYNRYLENAKYYYPADPKDITNYAILSILEMPDEKLKQLIEDKKSGDKYIKCKTGLDLYILRTIKMSAIYKSSPYQLLMNNPKITCQPNIITNEQEFNEFEKISEIYCKIPDIVYIIRNKLNLTKYQKELFLVVSGIEKGEWLGLTGLSKECKGELKVSSIAYTFNLVFKQLEKYVKENFIKENIICQ